MLRPERMREVTLLVPKADERRIIQTLADARLLHVRDHVKGDVQGVTIDIGHTQEDAAPVADALLRVRALLAAAKREESDGAIPGASTMATSARIAAVRAIADIVAGHERAILQVQSDTAEQRKRLDVLESLPHVDGDVRALAVSRFLRGILILNAAQPALMAAIAQEMPIERIASEDRKRVLLVMPTAQHDAALARLKAAGAQIPDIALLAQARGSLAQAIADAKARIGAASESIAAARAAIARLVQDTATLREHERELSLALLKIQAPLRFGETRSVALIRGWVPSAHSGALTAALDRSGARYVLDLGEPRDAPILLDNPRPARGFESLLAMYSLPRYGEIDPTSVMAITFPVFFGFMLGDIGYGLLLLIGAIIAARVRPTLRPFMEIVGISAASAIAFGALYGEAFGLERIGSFAFPALLHRMEDPVTLGIVALAFGVLHVNLGLAFGLVTQCLEHGIVHGVLRQGGWFLIEAGIACAIAGTPWILPALGIGLGLIGLAWSTGLVGIVESITLITHTLSYLRLAAIGLASVILALVINGIGGDLVRSGGIGIAIGVLVIVLGHAVNLALGLLDPFLHSMRLHYVEFFMKFYEGGGTRYRPFGQPQEAA